MKRNATLNDLMTMVEGLSSKDIKALAEKVMGMMRNTYNKGDSSSLSCNNMVREHIETEKPNSPTAEQRQTLGVLLNTDLRTVCSVFYVSLAITTSLPQVILFLMEREKVPMFG